MTETGKDSSALRDSSSVTWRGAGEASGVTGVRLSEISGGKRSWSRWGDGGLRWGGATGLQGHCERDRFSSHTHNDCVTGD